MTYFMSSDRSGFENVINFNPSFKIGWDIWERLKRRKTPYIDSLKEKPCFLKIVEIEFYSHPIFTIMVWIKNDNQSW